MPVDNEGYAKGFDYQCMHCNYIHHGPDAPSQPGKQITSGEKAGRQFSHSECPVGRENCTHWQSREARRRYYNRRMGREP